MQLICSRCAESFIGWTDLPPFKAGHLKLNDNASSGLGFPVSSRVIDAQQLFVLQQHCQSAFPLTFSRLYMFFPYTLTRRIVVSFF